MEEKSSTKDGRWNTKSSSTKSKSSYQASNQNGGLTADKTRPTTSGAEATSPVTGNSVDEPTPGPSGINNTPGHDAFLEELDA